ncbi:SDR family oxidoreductase [Pseudonocardia sp. RS11V-5]|uniref:SDR family NAD(P)-dependent oxidoreductase n=1 Tax=Pseudonocardia terrae TaxID=2905831 RepID=UPI001E344B9E|nr:SDR family oxidoreductase [Pseudonocardia terrae]MCE3550940.1 SDR family oxidoreductase [Pseudonocardia terrae]
MDSKVAVVTGGSRGMGREICRDLAGRGHRVVVASRKAEACEALAAELREEFGVPALGIACHVGRWADCDTLMDRVLEEFGRIDVLVNNAGMSPLYPSLGEVGEDLFDKVIGVNLKGPFRLAVRAGEAMQKGEGGQIVNVSSIAAVQPQPGELPYATAKAGLNALTLGLARAFGPTVRVNGVMPGMFRTDISKAWSEETLAHGETAPLGRIGEAEEIVGAVRYLTSADSSFTTGAILKVDGGMAWAPA